MKHFQRGAIASPIPTTWRMRARCLLAASNVQFDMGQLLHDRRSAPMGGIPSSETTAIPLRRSAFLVLIELRGLLSTYISLYYSCCALH
jgi:hypothetical protein